MAFNHQWQSVPTDTMQVTNASLNSFITDHIQPAIIRWETKFTSLKKGDSKDKSAQEERRRFLENLLHEISGEVSQLQRSIGSQSHPPVGHSDIAQPRRISDDMLLCFSDWGKQAKAIKEKNKATVIQYKREELSMLLSEILRYVAFWNQFVYQNKQQYHGRTRQQPSDGLPPQRPPDTQFTEEERKNLLEKINALHMKLDSKTAECLKNISEQNSHMEKLKKELARQKEEFNVQNMELLQVRRQKEEALTRLSEVAGHKLRQNNPGITDLSSENRPTKIAERFKELYANEWTDAFTELTKKCDDKKAIDILLITLLDSYEFTADLSEKHLRQLEYSAQMPTFIGEVDDTNEASRGKRTPYQSEHKGDESTAQRRTKQTPVQLSDECADLLKQLRKISASAFVLEIKDRFLKRRQAKLPETKGSFAMTEFNKACVDITWHMNVQTPPLVFAPKPATGKPVQTELYSMYTQSGDEVDYVVWPACLLHENGPLLAKGVVQPFKVERRKGAQGDRKSVVDPENINSVTKDKNKK